MAASHNLPPTLIVAAGLTQVTIAVISLLNSFEGRIKTENRNGNGARSKKNEKSAARPAMELNERTSTIENANRRRFGRSLPAVLRTGGRFARP